MARMRWGGGLGIRCGVSLIVVGLLGIVIGNGIAVPDSKTDPGFSALLMLPFALLKAVLPYFAWPLVIAGAVFFVLGVLSLVKRPERRS